MAEIVKGHVSSPDAPKPTVVPASMNSFSDTPEVGILSGGGGKEKVTNSHAAKATNNEKVTVIAQPLLLIVPRIPRIDNRLRLRKWRRSLAMSLAVV